MISIIFCSRAKDNPGFSLPALLESIVGTTSEMERKQIELLIKFDEDDELRPTQSEFTRWPFRVRTFSWSRGEGRHSLHHAQEYLFTQRDPRSRFCLMTADDFTFTRSGWVSNILSEQDEFCILGPMRPDIEGYAGIYDRDESIHRWAVAFGPLSPVISGRLIEVCQNFGWQANVDGWLMALSVALYDLYGITIWKTIEPFYERGGGAGLGDTPTYNDMELTGSKVPYNKYWLELVRRQARNLYLNMEHGTDLRQYSWKHWIKRVIKGDFFRKYWRKVSAQPLSRLPVRLVKYAQKRIIGSV